MLKHALKSLSTNERVNKIQINTKKTNKSDSFKYLDRYKCQIKE
jgi:hypothetical protein